MQEIDTGRASLKSPQGGDEFEVDNRITFTTRLNKVRRGLPPVARTAVAVQYIHSVEGKGDPTQRISLWAALGDYPRKSVGGSWHVLSWPVSLLPLLKRLLSRPAPEQN